MLNSPPAPKRKPVKQNPPSTPSKTGLTGRTVLLPSDDTEAYQSHVLRFFGEWKPETDAEHALVQSLADTEWRFLRIPTLESGIYAIGRLELADKLAAEQDESVRKSLIEAQIFLAYRRDLNNLSIQEIRLRRQREQDTARLEQFQRERREKHSRQITQAAQLYRDLKEDGEILNPAEFGFEFSIEEVEQRVALIDARNARSFYPECEVPERAAQLRAERLALTLPQAA